MRQKYLLEDIGRSERICHFRLPRQQPKRTRQRILHRNRGMPPRHSRGLRRAGTTIPLGRQRQRRIARNHRHLVSRRHRRKQRNCQGSFLRLRNRETIPPRIHERLRRPGRIRQCRHRDGRHERMGGFDQGGRSGDSPARQTFGRSTTVVVVRRGTETSRVGSGSGSRSGRVDFGRTDESLGSCGDSMVERFDSGEEEDDLVDGDS
mmetsp:Transcript_25115/g.51932  ORF Transcript_25115/g.51932 Transcript_25115/m.51932 type:complete len:206 (-) Transcript_25115:1075-1692(-)